MVLRLTAALRKCGRLNEGEYAANNAAVGRRVARCKLTKWPGGPRPPRVPWHSAAPPRPGPISLPKG